MDKIGTIQPKSSKFTWEINNFSNICTKVGEYIESPFFTAGEVSSNIIKWQLVLYPFGQKDDCKDFLSLYLVCILSDDDTECDVSYKFYLWENESGSHRYRCSVKFNNALLTRWGIPQFINKREHGFQHQLLSENDTLRIACSISNVYFHNKSSHQTELIESFDPLFLSDRFSDVTFVVDDKQLKAHKNILAARSEVFSAMFKHNTVESNENVIRIIDTSYDVMKEVLRFIYCGKVENLETHKEDLLAVANKYNIPLLKKICAQSLWNSINVNNAFEVLCIADTYHCDGLKASTANFLAINLKEFVASPGFNQLTDSNPRLLAEIVRQVAQKKDNC